MRLAQLLSVLPAIRQDLVTAIHGSTDVEIGRGRAIDLAEQGDLTFQRATDAAAVDSIHGSCASVIVVSSELQAAFEKTRTGATLVFAQSPRLLAALLLAPLAERSDPGDTPIHPTARMGDRTRLASGVVLGVNVRIGNDCVIGANTVIANAEIGDGTIIGTNCSIGGNGFGFEIDPDTGNVISVPHFGRVIIGQRVEIFANVCVARGSLRDTVIEDDVKIDNLVHVAHNCRIGRGAFLIAHAMIGGSASIGRGAWIAPHTAVMNGVTVDEWAMTGLGAVATKNIPANTVFAGVPARELKRRFEEVPGDDR